MAVLERHHEDPYENVLEADPSWVDLVIIGGDICYACADPGWHQTEGTGIEGVRAWGKQMILDTRFSTEPGDPNPSLTEVRALLTGSYPIVGPIFA